jgi:hypothetical protein
MATTWQIITVHVRRPPEVSLGEYFAAMRKWLDHHCIMLADFRGKGDVFDARFDNPRDARLFERRFGIQPTSNVPVLIGWGQSISATMSSIDQSRSETSAAIAGVTLSVL